MNIILKDELNFHRYIKKNYKIQDSISKNKEKHPFHWMFLLLSSLNNDITQGHIFESSKPQVNTSIPSISTENDS